MDLNHHNYSSIIPERDQDLPLDQVLKPRHTKKKLPSINSSDSDSNPSLNVPKLKTISKEKNDKTQQPTKPTQVSSTDLVRQLIFDQSLNLSELEELMIRLKNIKSLKYEKKLTEKIREALVETVFQYNYKRFMTIMCAFSPITLSSHLIAAIFQGFVLGWKGQHFNNLNIFTDFLKLYCQHIPNCINKLYVKWLSQRAKQKEIMYQQVRAQVLEHVNEVIKKSNRQRSSENEKIIGLIVYFELIQELDNKMLMKVVPLEKINDYIDNHNLITSNYLNANNPISPIHQKQKQNQKESEIKSSQHQAGGNHNRQSGTGAINKQAPYVPIPPLIHSSIMQLLRQNNLKQTEKLIRAHKIPHTQYPEFVQKLELKYLEYIERSYPIYFVDELISNKMSLVQNFVVMCLNRKKYDYVDHFVHKYQLRGVTQPNMQRIILSPLVKNDCFGPTESHVLHQYVSSHFSQLADFGITKNHVVWIDSKTIHLKPYAKYLINLLYLEEVGIDSESTSGIHVFERAKLEIIQLYDPKNNVVLLFDVRDLKNDKKKRNRKNDNYCTNEDKISEQNNVEEQKINKNLNGASKQKGKSSNQPIDLESYQQKLPSKQQTQQSEHSENLSNQKSDISPQKAWYKFTKVFQNMLKRTTIFGHCLHADIGEIIEELDLKIKTKDVSFRDSQLQFKKCFPLETKSKLGYLTEKCWGKELSKYEQCSAWDMRPLREAQRHYAALDAVLPYKLVKWMERKQGKSDVIEMRQK